VALYFRHLAGAISMLAATFSGFIGPEQLAQAQQQIALRFLDSRSGKPIEKLSVIVTFWNGDSGAHGLVPAERVIGKSSARTDKDGRVIINLPKPVPDHLSVFQPDLVDSFSPDFSPTAVLASGIVAPPRHEKVHSKVQISARPGEIVVLNKRLTAVDRMRREIP
jgi:hypothetical protein